MEGAETEYALFEAFVREHARSPFGTALLLCGHAGTAGDLVQDALAKSFERWDVAAGARSPAACVRRLLVHRFIDTGRGPRGRVMLLGEIPGTATDVDLGDAAAAKHAVQQSLAVLDERPRAALVLKYLYDWPDDQIAVAIEYRKVRRRLDGMLDGVTAIRYVTPLREGGSLPGLMEADDLGTYVVKFHGAGQGRKALIAEVVSAGLAGALALPVPRLVTVEVDPVLAANEPDEEVQDLLRRSAGTNLGVDFLPGALDLDVAAFPVDPQFAGRVLWFDALVGNADRSWRNPNMLFWHGAPYLIDHGATLTFHHRWPARGTTASYDAGEHALLGSAPDLAAADEQLAPLVTDTVLRAAVADIPDRWLVDEPGFAAPDEVRAAYVDELRARLDARAGWLATVHDTIATHGSAPRVARRNRPAWLGGGRS